MEEKEKEECAGRDRCGAHTHSHSVTLSERVLSALVHAGSPGARRIPSAAEKLLWLSLRDLFWEVHLLRGSSEPAESYPRGSPPRERRPPPPLPRELSAASATIAAAAPSKAPRAGARRGPGNRTGLRPRDRRGPRVHRERSAEAPALPAVGAELSSVCKLHPAGWNKSRLRRRARSAFPRGSPDVQTRGPSRPRTGCGSVPCALP